MITKNFVYISHKQGTTWPYDLRVELVDGTVKEETVADHQQLVVLINGHLKTHDVVLSRSVHTISGMGRWPKDRLEKGTTVS